MWNASLYLFVFFFSSLCVCLIFFAFSTGFVWFNRMIEESQRNSIKLRWVRVLAELETKDEQLDSIPTKNALSAERKLREFCWVVVFFCRNIYFVVVVVFIAVVSTLNKTLSKCIIELSPQFQLPQTKMKKKTEKSVCYTQKKNKNNEKKWNAFNGIA